MHSLHSPKDVIPFQKAQDSIFSTLITRKISRVITFYLLRAFPRITPNQVSVFSLVLCVVACRLLIVPSYGVQIVGVITLQLSFAVDCSDGEVARITKKMSPFGAWFDSLLDRFKEVFMIGSLTYYAYLYLWHDVDVVWLGAAAATGLLIVAFIREAKKASWPTQRVSELFITKNIYIGTVDVIVYAVSFAVVVQWHVVVLAGFAVVSVPLMIKQLMSAYRLK